MIKIRWTQMFGTCLVFFALLLFVSAGQASAEPSTVLLDEDFNAMTTGAAPAGWNLENVLGGTAAVQAFPSGTDKSVKLTDTSASNPVIVSKWIDGGTGVLTVEFDMYPAQTGDFLAAGYLLDAAGSRSARVYFNHTTNEIQVYNGTAVEVVQTYVANTWYHFKYVVDTNTSKFDVYVDGVLKKTNMGFSEAAISVSKIQFFSGAPAGVGYFDNVQVRTGGMLKLPTNKVFEAYDDQTTASAPSGWTLDDTSGGTIAIAAEPSATDKSVKLNDTSASNAVTASRSFASATGSLTVEFDIKPGQTGTYIDAGVVMDASGNKAVRVYFDNASNTIKAYNGAALLTVQPYTANTWYRLKYVMSASTDKYDLYVNNRIVSYNLSFNTAVASLSKVQFGIGATTSGSVLIDNLNIAGEGGLDTAFFGSTRNLSGNRIGGGEGYQSLVTSWTDFVSTGAQLVSALASATAGDVIYIDPAANINMTALTLPLNVPGGVTIASSRGKIINGAVSAGARLYGQAPGLGYFKVMGDNVRFTGLMLDGLDYEVGTEPYVPQVTHGINTELYSTTEVDNNIIKGFSWAGISMNDGYIHHNYIHSNRRTGLGYGIVQKQSVGDGILIEGNLFSMNRHSISSTGKPTNKYEARYNTVVTLTVGHGFDMHGDTGCSCAGSTIKIHHNTFQDTSSLKAILIREVPVVGAYINNNWFYDSTWANEINQSVDYGHMYVGENKYGTGSGIQYLTNAYSQI